MKYTFIDAQEMHRLHPDTFEVPTLNEMYNIAKGDFVKVGLQFAKTEVVIRGQLVTIDSERFWVQVTKISGDTITGNIENDLVGIESHGVDYLDELTFERKNICSIMKENE